ncbi:MAG: DUF4249 domain-containing protein [Saprospiraceae bacterium]|nr:DUF4249 domain-containing protein [Saprospiraceae bacterium]
MKNIILGSILLLAFGLTMSCEKVIDLDLNEASPKPVFESYIEEDSVCYVSATWTSSYYDNSTSEFIPNATITISDGLGNSENLVYQGDGVYTGNTIRGTVGRTYSLQIDVDGNNYTASSTMPPLVGIDSFTVQSVSDFFGGVGPGGGKPTFWVYANYTDPANEENFYAVRTTYWDSVEARYTTDYSIDDDNISDGISTRAFTTFNRFEVGDTLVCELPSIDYPTWLYFKTLEDALSGAGVASAAPANPTTNIQGGALGYFGAWAKSRKEYIVIP